MGWDSVSARVRLPRQHDPVALVLGVHREPFVKNADEGFHVRCAQVSADSNVCNRRVGDHQLFLVIAVEFRDRVVIAHLPGR